MDEGGCEGRCVSKSFPNRISINHGLSTTKTISPFVFHVLGTSGPPGNDNRLAGNDKKTVKQKTKEKKKKAIQPCVMDGKRKHSGRKSVSENEGKISLKTAKDKRKANERQKTEGKK